MLSTIPTAGLPSRDPGPGPVYPAPPGYLLPWEGGRIHDVTQGEETTFTHNGRLAYAFDFNLNYDTVVAARSGRVTHLRMNSNAGGCGGEFAGAANYIVIDHGDGTSAQYLHLAYASSELALGDLVRQGEPIAISGETGITCTGIDEDINPAPHLHFQVQRNTDSESFTQQSLPVTFDDVPDDEGVPQEGESYVSGNYGPGKPQKIQLTPRRVPRPFDPRAVPADPNMFEVVEETPTPEPTTTETTTATATMPVEPGATETPIPTETPLPEDTPTPGPTDTPPAPTDTTPTAEPSPEPSLPAEPSPEPTPEAEGTPAAPPDDPTPSVYVPSRSSTTALARRRALRT
jgi:murein DD-endopeptidase MepM/ murein hydrolase activator NlpD